MKGIQGNQIRNLFLDERDEVVIVAPFIKVGALKSIIADIPKNTKIRCVTRWLPGDVAAGVSDPEIIYILEERGNYSLELVDNLHAKLYVAGSKCLVGSSNISQHGLGEASDSNIELLVETETHNPHVSLLLDEIEQNKLSATFEMAEKMLQIPKDSTASLEVLSEERLWIPHSRKPQLAYKLYCDPPVENISRGDKILLKDIVEANLPPSLSEDQFNNEIRFLLDKIPVTKIILDDPKDAIITFEDVHEHFDKLVDSEFSSKDLWLSFVNWMSHFFSDEVVEAEKVEIVLRRASLLI